MCQAGRMLWVFEIELCLHGFRKMVIHCDVRGRVVAGYAHPSFKMGKPELLGQIQRSIAFDRDKGDTLSDEGLYSGAAPDGQSRPEYTKHPRFKPERAGGARRGHHAIFRMGKGGGNSHMWVLARPSATEAAEFLSHR